MEPTENKMISGVYLFAGPCDGMSILANDKTSDFKVGHSILIDGDESYVSAVHKPGMERRTAFYAESPEWSACLGKRTAVYAGFEGKAPRAKAAA